MKIWLRFEYLSLILVGFLTGIIVAAAMMLHGIWHIITMPFVYAFYLCCYKTQKKKAGGAYFRRGSDFRYLLYCVFVSAFPGG